MTRNTDRRRELALDAKPASKEPGASKFKRGAAVRVHPLVGLLSRRSWLKNERAGIINVRLAARDCVVGAKSNRQHCDLMPVRSSPLFNPVCALLLRLTH